MSSCFTQLSIELLYTALIELLYTALSSYFTQHWCVIDEAKTSLRLARSEANATRGMLDKQVRSSCFTQLFVELPHTALQRNFLGEIGEKIG